MEDTVDTKRLPKKLPPNLTSNVLWPSTIAMSQTPSVQSGCEVLWLWVVSCFRNSSQMSSVAGLRLNNLSKFPLDGSGKKLSVTTTTTTTTTTFIFIFTPGLKKKTLFGSISGLALVSKVWHFKREKKILLPFKDLNLNHFLDVPMIQKMRSHVRVSS